MFFLGNIFRGVICTNTDYSSTYISMATGQNHNFHLWY